MASHVTDHRRSSLERAVMASRGTTARTQHRATTRENNHDEPPQGSTDLLITFAPSGPPPPPFRESRCNRWRKPSSRQSSPELAFLCVRRADTNTPLRPLEFPSPTYPTRLTSSLSIRRVPHHERGHHKVFQRLWSQACFSLSALFLLC